LNRVVTASNRGAIHRRLDRTAAFFLSPAVCCLLPGAPWFDALVPSENTEHRKLAAILFTDMGATARWPKGTVFSRTALIGLTREHLPGLRD
jgi:hypothetical protein